ncbi:rho guanine nucleotide exchange factor 7-like isoform X2 [Coregonus clupeaformis]|uniref:rho guanine nucleotide exchange factor 7-like isoform X2 n=1 Tax=Coregonus clupeaformis TaxID=59861 RepID=UPI001BDF771C|nr:rho guanine nucleotide exchange factor 7-like isoform X2 [Coregonus clupeaformis]XP_041699828.1 rho guanine nucleotide exchange factor 7-like isoform X2 [Coregonus clupeaformis]
MNSAEQTVTWLITLGVLESPKKNISDPEAFLQTSLKDGVVLCRLLERLSPGSTDKIYQEPKNDGDRLSNIKEFLKGCTLFRVEPFEPSDMLLGLNFSKILSSLVALNKLTADIGVGSDSVCAHHSSTHRIKSFESLASQSSLGRSSKLLLNRSLDMSEGSGTQLLVKARFNFEQTNEDELSFNKSDVIIVTRQEEGGWWEGNLNGKTGWFPSNYVREIKGCDKQVSPKSGTLKSPPKGFDTTAISKIYYNLVLQNILETETEYSKDLQSLLTNYLRYLQSTEKLSSTDVYLILGNLEEISTFQQMLVQSLDECTKLPESQQKVGGFFLNLMPQMKALYVGYCSNHPSAVNVLTQHSEELGEFMEGKGASSPGILTLTTGLSKPFMRLDKYPTLLKELERHMEESHPDRPDIQKCMTTFKSFSAQCQEVRKRKELELQIVTEPIRLWEGDDIRTLGSVLYMSQALVKSPGAEEKCERYLMLFPHVLLMLSATPRMSGFIFQGKLPLAGMTVTTLEDSEAHKNSFELSGSLFEHIQVVCNNQQDLQDWVDHLTRQTRQTTATVPSQKPLTVPCQKPLAVPSHTLPSHPLTPSRHAESRAMTVAPAYHTLPHPSSHGAPHSTMMWGPLEPPNTPKPWSLSCLRPAPPLRPSAALCYKEDLSKSPKSVKKLLPKRKPERKQSEEESALRKSTVALEEDAQILKVIEAYCTSAKTRQTLNSTWQGTDLMHNHVLGDVDRSSVDSPGHRSSVSRPDLTGSDLSEDSDYDSVWTAHSYRMGSVSRATRSDTGLQVIIPGEEKIIMEETRSNRQTVVREKSLEDVVYALRDEVQELQQDNKRMKRSLKEEQRVRKDLDKVIRRVLKSMNNHTWDETNL